MKILFLTPSFYPKIGGVETHVYEISRALQRKGHKIVVITEGTSEEEYEGLANYQSGSKSDIEAGSEEKTVKSIYLNNGNKIATSVFYFCFGRAGRGKKFRIWWELFRNRKLIEQADIIHCHDVFVWYLPFCLLYPKKPVYTTFHGYEQYPLHKKNILIHKLSEWLSWGNICIGDFIKKWYSTNPTFISYGGVNITGRKSRVTIKNSAVFIGRLDEHTGILTYLEAVRIIKKKIPDFSFTVIGDGKFRNKIRKDTKLLGFRYDTEDFLFKNHFSFVSRYLSILEAMAAKRLVIATYDHSLKEDYLRTSPFSKYIAIENSPKRIAERVLYYLREPNEEKKLVNQAFEWVKSQTWNNVAETYLKLWKIEHERV